MPNRFRRELLISALIIVGSIAVFGIGLYILSGVLDKEAADIADNRLTIARASAYLATLADLKKSSQAADRYRAAIEELLVPQEQLIEFPGWLDGIARTRDVELRFSFSGSETQPQGDVLGFIGFSVDVNGSLDALTSFFREVESESQRFLVSIDTLTLIKIESGYAASSRGKVFFR